MMEGDKEKIKKQERIIVSYFKFDSFSLHQTELNTLVIKRDMNFFMGDFLKPVSHAQTLWDNSKCVRFEVPTVVVMKSTIFGDITQPLESQSIFLPPAFALVSYWAYFSTLKMKTEERIIVSYFKLIRFHSIKQS
jgi:hypothetical protein